MNNIKVLFVFLFLTACLSINSDAQTQEGTETKSVEIWFGLENRITPIYTDYKNGQVIRGPVLPVNIDKQLSGTAFSIGVALLLPNIETYISFEYAARYDHLYYRQDNMTQFSESVNGIISDYHIRLSKPINVKSISITPGLGYSSMNHGTEYRAYSSGSWGEKDLKFNCFDLSVGFGVKQFDFELRTYLIGENRYDYNTGFIILPEIKLKYRIHIF